MVELLSRGGAARYYWAKAADGRKTTRWQATTEPATLPAAVQADIYWGVHPCTSIPAQDAQGRPARPEHLRARNDLIAAVNCFFGEWDAHPAEGQTQTDALCVALDKVAALRYQPTTMICSGGGYHCYWMMPEPFIIRNDADRQMLRKLQADFVQMIGSDPASKDLARVLRVPGTYNLKPGRGRFVVRYVHPIIDDRFYSFDTMRGWIESGQAGAISEAINADTTAAAQRVQISAAATMTADANVIVNIPQATPQAAQVIEAQRVQPSGAQAYALQAAMGEAQAVAATREGGRNDALNKAAYKLGGYVGAGAIDPATAAAALESAAQRAGLPASETAATIASGLNAGAAKPRAIPERPAQGRQAPRQATRNISDMAAQIKAARAARAAQDAQGVNNG
jgi:hypothetical protein